MEKIFANMANGKMVEYLEVLATELKVDNDALRIVIKIEKGSLGIFLFNGSKFVRRLEMVDLVKVLIPSP